MRSKAGWTLVGTLSLSIVAARLKINDDRDEILRRKLIGNKENTIQGSNEVPVETHATRNTTRELTFVHRDVDERFGPCLNEILKMKRDFWDLALFLPSTARRLRNMLLREAEDVAQVCIDTEDDNINELIHVAREAVRDTSTRLVLTRVDIPKILEFESEIESSSAQIIFPLSPSHTYHEETTLPHLEYGASYAFLRFLKTQKTRTVDLNFTDAIVLRDLQVSYPDRKASESLNSIALELLRHNLVRLSPKPQSHWDDIDDDKSESYMTFDVIDLKRPFTSSRLQKRFRLSLNVSDLQLDYSKNPSLFQYDKTLDERYLELDEMEIKRQREHFTQEVERIMPILNAQDEEKRTLGLLELDRYERELVTREDEIERRRVGIEQHYTASKASQSKLY